MAERTAVQEVACQPGRELLLASDGTVSACRIAAAADLLVAPDAGNDKAACAAGAQVEFHRNGYLSFCNPVGAGGGLRRRAAAGPPAAAPARGSPSTRKACSNIAREPASLGRSGRSDLSHIATGRTVLSCPT